MKKLLFIALLSTLGFSYTLVMPYGAFIDYSDDTIKDIAYDGGVYIDAFKFPFKIELGGDYLKIRYKKNLVSDYYEKDLTAIGHYYIGNNYEIKAGIRNMYIDQNGNDDKYDKVLIGGILYYKYLKYNLGLDYYYSTYDNFDVKQFTSHFGFNFGNYYSSEGAFYFDMKLNFIKVSDRIKANTKHSNYIDGDISLSNYQGPWTTTIKASYGKNVYKVANGGFVVYNLGEEYKYNVGINISYKLNRVSALTIGYTNTHFKESNKNAYSNSYLISYSISF